MGTPMHFRKRQLLEYQIETSSSQHEPQQTHINDPKYNYISEPQPQTLEYPLSPSSMESEQSTPTKCYNHIPVHNSINANEYSTEHMQILANNTVTLLEMDNLSPKSSKDAQKLKQISESLTVLENYSLDPNVHLAGNVGKLTYDPSTLINFAYNLKHIIEEYITQEISNASANKSSVSTLILAKLNQLRVNALLQPKQYVEQLPYDRAYYPSEQEMELVPEDLSMKRNEHQSCPEQQLLDEDMDYEEPKLVIDESYVEIEMNSGDDDVDRNSEKTKSKNQNKRSGLQQIATRISGIFTFMNRSQTRMEELMKKGINVYEKAALSSSKSKTKSSSSKKSKKLAPQSSSSSNTQPPKVPNNANSLKKPLNVLNQVFEEFKMPKELPKKLPKKLSKKLSKKNASGKVRKPKPWTNGKRDDLKYNNYYPIQSPLEDSKLIIGPNGTTIPKTLWAEIDWKQTPPAITRKILINLFERGVLATHSLTGRPSPAFLELNYPEKKPLDANIVSDLVDLVTSRTIGTAKEVRMAITTKCADESKMRRGRERKLQRQMENLRMRPY